MAWSWKKLNTAKKAMIRRGAVALVAYELVWCATCYWVFRTKPAGPVLLLIAVLPTLTVVGFIAVLAKYLGEEVDEFHRQLVVRCLLWGTAAVMTSVCFHCFLQLFGWKGNWPAGVDLGAFLLAMAVAKLTYKVQNRVPDDADAMAEREGAR
jgi:phosphatidylglycerophosphate synthase